MKTKAWALTDNKGKILVVSHGQKEPVLNYNVCITKKEAQKCMKYHDCRWAKLVRVEITII